MRKLILLFSLAAFIGLSSFETSGVKVDHRTTENVIKIKIAPNQDVFTKHAQEFMVVTLTRAANSEDHPCSGSCVCDKWTASGTGYYRACGCYTWGFWYEYKPCYYCVPQPNYGSTCQNG